MIKVKEKSFNGAENRHRGKLASVSWTLCVGAGISIGMVPTWRELTSHVVKSAYGSSYTNDDFEMVRKQTNWGLDALIQGAANKLMLAGKSPEEFADLIENAVYGDILKRASRFKREVDWALVEALNNPRILKKDEILSLCDFFESEYPDSSTLGIAEQLTRAKLKNRGPTAVINFNADTLLYAVLEIFLIRNYYLKEEKWHWPKAQFKTSVRAVDSNRDITPIYHCHGSVSPQPRRPKRAKKRDARDKLVFREKEYLDIAGSMSTWAQTIFLFHAQSTTLVIIGHSLSDPNIRKWLSWTHDMTSKEIALLAGVTEVSPRHIWITTRSSEIKVDKLMEVSLLHLGVKICWINEWSELSGVLGNLLALNISSTE